MSQDGEQAKKQQQGPQVVIQNDSRLKLRHPINKWDASPGALDLTLAR